jgi:hypothetical protein
MYFAQNKFLHMHPPVEVPDGRYTLVQVDEDDRAGGDVHHVIADQDLDQSLEGFLTACADNGRPRFIINLCVSFKLLNLRSGVELKH